MQASRSVFGDRTPRSWPRPGSSTWSAVTSLLEDQLCTWAEGEKSPDRLDAAIHAVNALRKGYSGAATNLEDLGAVPYSDRPVPGGAVPWGGESEGWPYEPARSILGSEHW